MKVLTKISTIVMVGLLAAASGCASTSHNKDTSTPKHESTGEYLDDTVITTKVKAAVLNEPSLKSAEINVETYKGVVQLSGFVNSAEDIDKAIEVARGVKGVASVKNDMRLKAK
ncbi:BON domain-containing protein [Methylotenera sp.]|uniref:BON domain-containing protein n=1 Tax=Methylotenera sp. TaxID=2051956 RepID=UPI002EDB2CED